MIVRLSPRRRHLLSYEMNAHPGESLAELRRSLHRFTLPVRELVAPGERFAIAPRVGKGLLRDLASKRRRRELAAELRDLDVFPYTINAFPLEDFHARRVKENVYSPPWTRKGRATLTCRIADWLAETLPEGEIGTVSTLGGTYRPWGHRPADFARIADNYLDVVTHLAKLEARTGKTILLTAEPEPDTTFETAADVIALVTEYMLPRLRDRVARPLRVSTTRAEELCRRYFTVNLDVCHQSVLFRDPVAEWKELEVAGLRVGKLHITNALALRRPGRSPAAVQELRTYREPRYLHQFAARLRDGAIERGRDLDALRQRVVDVATEIRCHFHVPLSRARMGRLYTTRDDTAKALAYALAHRDPPHLAIETYTWPILTRNRRKADRDRELVRGIAREFRWTLARMRA